MRSVSGCTFIVERFRHPPESSTMTVRLTDDEAGLGVAQTATKVGIQCAYPMLARPCAPNLNPAKGDAATVICVCQDGR